MKHTIKLLTVAITLAAILTLTGCPGPVNNYIETPVHEHVFGDWGDWEVVTAATCTKDGSKKRTRTCSCGEIEEETVVIPALGHDFNDWVWSEWTTTKEMTYQQDEEKTRSGTRTCKRCGLTENNTQTEVTSRFVAGGYDGNDVPTEDAETYHYLYKGADDYQISAYVYSSVENAKNSENERVLYFSFPNNTKDIPQIVIGNNGPKITIDRLVQMKNEYVGKTVKYFAYDYNTLLENINTSFNYPKDSELLKGLDSGSPIYIVIE